jgi:type I restriction enzyme S subunit
VTPGNFYERGGFRDRGSAQKGYEGPVPDDYVLKPGALVVAMTEQGPGLLGSSAVIPNDGKAWLHNQRIGLVLSDPGTVESRFIYYLLNNPAVRDQISATATGTKVRHTAPRRIEAVQARFPPLATQRRIAAVLSAFDELIEINERRIELLEDLARSLYREWFVHFRFPGHEDVELVDSELGPIPEGWEVKKLKEVVTLDKGLSYKGAHLTDVGRPMANLKCLAPSGGFRRGGTKPYSGAFKPRQAVSPGDLIVANTDLTQAGHVVGSPAIVPARNFTGGGLISHHLFAVRPVDGPVAVPFLFQMFAHERFRSFARGRASGTTVLGLRADDVQEFRFVAPPAWLRDAFGAIAAPLHQQADALRDLSEDRVATRDLLLPRLVTGRLDISDIDLGVLTPAELE